ncbi:hypothetical protein QTP70_009770 [Hemibagrus guttatus]|uniref:Endonuclease/exonuclease/phosphatase domain-containing protein n=1 Tax=Hemibagrus guttatus TaxID=175788 RepID=A0AAE0Q3Q2_9TELE|nr:hypothetical protein QTP70_009770 [Hemibagrus guttatus]
MQVVRTVFKSPGAAPDAPNPSSSHKVRSSDGSWGGARNVERPVGGARSRARHLGGEREAKARRVGESEDQGEASGGDEDQGKVRGGSEKQERDKWGEQRTRRQGQRVRRDVHNRAEAPNDVHSRAAEPSDVHSRAAGPSDVHCRAAAPSDVHRRALAPSDVHRRTTAPWRRCPSRWGLELPKGREGGSKVQLTTKIRQSQETDQHLWLSQKYTENSLKLCEVNCTPLSEISSFGFPSLLNTVDRNCITEWEVGCELEEKERFWSELDEVMESIPTGERVVIGADFNGHVVEGNTGDEEVMGKFGVKERNLEGQMVVLPDDWETTAEVIRETGRKVLGVSSGRRKEDKETWWWNEEVQDSIQRKRLAKKKWDMDRTEENRQEYKELQRRVKREVSKAKQKAYEELYTRLDTREGEKDLYRLARQRDRDGKDVQQVRVIKDRDGRVLTSEESVQRRWKEYFEELMNEENEREKE